MEFDFKIKEDRLICGNVLDGNSGSVNTYVCKFEIDGDANFTWICVFKKGQQAYQKVIEDNKCIIPEEVLKVPGMLYVGCYGTSGDKRISTNWVEFKVAEGAYCEATMPQEPTPDLWETLVMNSLPYIGENGNWYVYNKATNKYVDSNKPARGEQGDKGEKGEKGENGYSPKRGLDYWTNEDREVIKKQIEDELNLEERLLAAVGNYGNKLNKSVSANAVAICDISPVEHIMDIRVTRKNILKYPYYHTDRTHNGITFTDNKDGSITLNGESVATASFTFQTELQLVDGVEYTFSVKNGETKGMFSYFNEVGTAVFVKTPCTIKWNNNYTFRSIYVEYRSGEILDNVTIYPQLEIGNTATSYAPYVETLENITVKKYGVNLFDLDNYSYNVENVSDSQQKLSEHRVIVQGNKGATNAASSGIFRIELPDELRVAGTEITVSMDVTVLEEGAYDTGTYLWLENKKEAVLGSGKVMLPVNKKYRMVVAFLNIPKNIDALRFYLNNNKVLFDIDTLQIQIGMNATEYESYMIPEEYTVDSDGVVTEILSTFPSATFITNTEGVIISCTYAGDINKAFSELKEALTNAIISLGGNV